MIRFSEAAWTAILAADTAAGRAQALSTLNPTTIEFLDAADAVIRTVTTGNWTVSGANAVPGTYTDAGTGGGTPATAVFKASGTEVMRMSCGTLAGSDYLLLANIVASVKIRRGSFAVTFLDPPGVGTSEPAATVAPVISGTAQVGQTLTATAGTWTGNPVPTITRQWYRGASAISGATGLFYTLVEADAGAIISFVETGTNAVGSVTSTSNALGPVADGALDASAVPSPINIDQGGTFDFTPYISGGVPPYTVAVASGSSLPAEVTLTNNVLTASGSATVALSGDIVFDVDDSAVAATLPTFGVLSSVGGADLPFAFGHVFKQGDMPSGSYVDSDLTDWQCVPTTTWPDGSLRHAIIAGRATCTQNVRKDITLSVSGTDRSGTALTQTDLAAALPTVTVQGGAHTTTLNSLVGTSALHRTVCTGPIMSNWIYRHPVTASNHLVVWIDVRLYKGGRVEIFPWVENAYLTVANPTNDVRTWTVTIGGTQVFSQSIDIKHHTRIPLISGSSFSYWTTDPGIVPMHDGTYLMASKMIDNLDATPVEAAFTPLVQTYTPNSRGNYTWAGNGGTSGSLIEHWSALYVLTGDVRAWRSVVANGLACGSFSIHYRDSTTHEPIKFSDYPSASLQGGSPSIPAGVGEPNGAYAITHSPSMAYLPWLLTGRWHFLDELLFVNSHAYLQGDSIRRFGAEGFINPRQGELTERGAAWAMRDLSETLVSLPSIHPCYADVYEQWAANMDRAKRYWIDGELYSDQYMTNKDWSNELGQIPPYANYRPAEAPASSAYWPSPWMNNYYVAAVGRAWNMDPPQTTETKAKHQALRDWLYRYPVGLAGGGFGWRHFGNYTIPISDSVASGLPSGFKASWADVYTEWLAHRPNAVTDMTEGLSLKYGGLGADDVTQSSFSDGLSDGSFLGPAIVALALAREHGATGADAAWSRITGSSSWSLRDGAYNAWPRRGVMPR